MTFIDRSSAPDRAFGLLSSLAIHAALGIALIAWPPIGTDGKRARDDRGETVLVVELLPLSEAGTHPSPSSGDNGEIHAEPTGTVRSPLGTPPPAQGGATPAATSAGGSQAEPGKAAVGAVSENASGAVQHRSGAETQQFRLLLLRHIEKFRRYPPDAREAGLEGTVQVQFRMNAQGQVLDAWIEMSSGSKLLDDEAVAAVLRARPLPAPPAGWPATITVSLPIGFNLT